MNYKEIKQDIFELDPKEYYFVQCISADMAMGKGIAIQFNKHFNTKTEMSMLYNHDFVNQLWEDTGGCCLTCYNVFNLITKKRYWEKPTLESLNNALAWLKELICATDIVQRRKLAMPKIGCGLDKLKWEDVRALILKVFEDTDVDITVCYLGDEA